MRVLIAAALGLLIVLAATPASAQASRAPEVPSGDYVPGDDLSMQNYLALTADQDAQLSLGGFRSFLERTRAEDPSMYSLLDPRLDTLEERETMADVVFWTGTTLSVLALGAAIPVHEELGLDASLGFIVGGASAFLLTLIIQAVLRPGHSDLMSLIDLYDRRLGRR